MEKKVTVSIEEYDQIAEQINKEFTERWESLQECLRFFSDPAESFRVVLQPQFLEAQQKVVDSIYCYLSLLCQRCWSGCPDRPSRVADTHMPRTIIYSPISTSIPPGLIVQVSADSLGQLISTASFHQPESRQAGLTSPHLIAVSSTPSDHLLTPS